MRWVGVRKGERIFEEILKKKKTKTQEEDRVTEKSSGMRTLSRLLGRHLVSCFYFLVEKVLSGTLTFQYHRRLGP